MVHGFADGITEIRHLKGRIACAAASEFESAQLSPAPRNQVSRSESCSAGGCKSHTGQGESECPVCGHPASRSSRIQDFFFDLNFSIWTWISTWKSSQRRRCSVRSCTFWVTGSALGSGAQTYSLYWCCFEPRWNPGLLLQQLAQVQLLPAPNAVPDVSWGVSCCCCCCGLLRHSLQQLLSWGTTCYCVSIPDFSGRNPTEKQTAGTDAGTRVIFNP